MIKSYDDYLYYLEADRQAKAIRQTSGILGTIKYLLYPNHVWEFQKLLRKLEYYTNCKKGVVAIIQKEYLKWRFRKLSLKLGFTIPINVFGPGLSIAHYGTIIVNKGAKVGANCRLHACVNIGTEAGHNYRAPKIGDNCYIGPGVKMFGDIHIADNIIIGANAVVNKSFEENCIAIAGVPAKKIAEIDITK